MGRFAVRRLPLQLTLSSHSLLFQIKMSLAEKWPRLHSDLRAFRDHFPGFDPTVHPSDGIRKVRFGASGLERS